MMNIFGIAATGGFATFCYINRIWPWAVFWTLLSAGLLVQDLTNI